MPPEGKVFRSNARFSFLPYLEPGLTDVILSAADVLSLQARQQLDLSSSWWGWGVRWGVTKSRDVELAYMSGDSSGSLTSTRTLHIHYRNVYKSVSVCS